MTPLGQSDGAVELEIVSVVERALLVEMVADGGMNGGELLQTSHATEPLHCSQCYGTVALLALVVGKGDENSPPDC